MSKNRQRKSKWTKKYEIVERDGKGRLRAIRFNESLKNEP